VSDKDKGKVKDATEKTYTETGSGTPIKGAHIDGNNVTDNEESKA
jgi:hypothetical protein